MTRRWAVMAGTALLAGCGRPAALGVDGAWVRLAANPGAPAAGYFTLHGGAAPASLVRVGSDGAARAELHESMTRGGMSGMAPLASVAVPAGGTVSFAPRGRHVMLFGVAPTVRAGGTLAMTFTFAGGERLATAARVVGPGDPAP